MKKRIVKIDTEIFDSINKDISTDGIDCKIDDSIMSCLSNTIESQPGRILAEYVEELCKSSELYSKHSGSTLPTAFDKMKKTIVKADLEAANSLKTEGQIV